jgi:hypothetical protein
MGQDLALGDVDSMSGLTESGHDWPIYELAVIFPGTRDGGSRSRTADPETLRDGRWSGVSQVPAAGGGRVQRHPVAQVAGHLLRIS